MRVILSNFMGYADPSEFVFADGTFTLIKGKSGAGKTSILEAIAWCLFKKNRGIKPRHNPNARTTVYVEIFLSPTCIFTVTRYRAPGLLNVSLSSQWKHFQPGMYQDVVAQSIIDDILGNSDVWQCSSYVQQDERNMFLSSNNTGRMEILTRLAFRSDDPSAYTSKISEHITITTKNYESAVLQLNNCIKTYQEQSSGVDLTTYKSPQDLQLIKSQIDSHQQELDTLIIHQNNRSITLRESEVLHQLKSSITSSLQQCVPPVPPSELSFTSTDESLLHTLQCLLHQKDQILKKIPITDLVAILPQHASLTDDSLQYISSHCSLYDASLNICKDLNVQYHTDSVNTRIQELQNEIDKHQQWKIFTQVKDLEKQLTDLPIISVKEFIKPSPPTPLDVSVWQSEINDLTLQINGTYSEVNALVELNKKLKQYNTDRDRLKQCTDQLSELKSRVFTAPQRPHSIDISDSKVQAQLKLKALSDRDHQLVNKLICPSCKNALDHCNGKLHAFNLTEEQVLSERSSIASQISSVQSSLSQLLQQERDYVNDMMFYDKLQQEYIMATNTHISRVSQLESEISQITQRLQPVDVTAEELSAQYALKSKEYNDLCEQKKKKTDMFNDAQAKYNIALQSYNAICSSIDREQRDYDTMVTRNNSHRESLIKQIDSTRGLLNDINMNDTQLVSTPSVLQSTINRLKTVRIMESPMEKYGVENVQQATVILKNIQHNKMVCDLRSQLDNVNDRLNGIVCDPSLKEMTCEQLMCVLNDIRKYKMDSTRHMERVEMETRRLKEVQEKINNVVVPDDRSDRIQELKDLIKQLSTSYSIGTKTLEVYELYQKMQQQQVTAQSLYDRLNNLHILKTRSLDVECYLLQKTVDEINHSISDVIGLLFDDPITVQLQLYKMDKKLNAKPCVNFLIQYKGCEMDNITRLSGGEKTRVSLALTLALSRMSSCPFLMLDEILHNVDDDVRETSVDAIREVVGNKCILFVGHGLVEGHYDTVLKV